MGAESPFQPGYSESQPNKDISEFFSEDLSSQQEAKLESILSKSRAGEVLGQEDVIFLIAYVPYDMHERVYGLWRELPIQDNEVARELIRRDCISLLGVWLKWFKGLDDFVAEALISAGEAEAVLANLDRFSLTTYTHDDLVRHLVGVGKSRAVVEHVEQLTGLSSNMRGSVEMLCRMFRKDR